MKNFIIILGALLQTVDIKANKTTSEYDPEKLLVNTFDQNDTISARQANYGLIKFEGQTDDQFGQSGQITFEDHTRPFQFEDQGNLDPNFDTQNSNQDAQNVGQNYGLIKFQDDNQIEQGVSNQIKKKRRRRRKPRFQQLPNQRYPQFYPNGIYPGSNYPDGPKPGPLQLPQGGYNPHLYPGYPSGQFYRPSRRPRPASPSVASQALSSVTGALSSIALYDDYQCVPRLLCEAAGGGALGSSSLLQSVAGLQPLLTLLSAYNGISTSPLFVFGRAVFLGMTSKSNPGTCRYAYPLCPNDPEQLVHYLNNHNGGFFRFFNVPQQLNPQLGQQNLEQFYNQLAFPSQNDGFYQQNQVLNEQQYGLYDPLNQHSTTNGYQRPGLYDNGYGYKQNYGFGYPHNQNRYGFNQVRFKDSNDREQDTKVNNNRIEKRIQNKPGVVFVNTNTENIYYATDHSSKWLFPDENNINNVYVNSNIANVEDNNFRIRKALKFPQDEIKLQADTLKDSRRPKGFIFPANHSNRQYVEYDNYSPVIPVPNLNHENINQGHFNFNNVYSGTFYNIDNDNDYYNNDEEEKGIRTIYIVRGNGDPYNPEVVKLRPGESLN